MTNIDEWVKVIFDHLLAAEMRRIESMLVQLNDKNSALKAPAGSKFYGFVHMGKTYIPEEYSYLLPHIPRQQRHKLIPPIALELAEEVGTFASEVAKLESDKTAIHQMLFKLLRPVTTMQELRDALPDCVATKLPQLASLQRQNPDPTWSIKNDPRALREYDRVLPRIEFYSVSHLLY